jgi:hypothetical protein
MASRLRIIGVVLIIVGIVSWAAAGYAFLRMQEGQDALQGFSEAQNVTLSYRDGQLIDRGTTEGADAIYELLGEAWGWPINDGELDADDALVDTATEYMFQMATIAYHTLTGTQTVVLTERIEWDGDGDGEVATAADAAATEADAAATEADAETAGALVYTGGKWDPATVDEDAIFEPGVYEVPVNGRYWTAFNRLHPLDGPARSQAWNGTVHGLFAELGVGAVTATSLQMALGIVGVTALMGLGFVVGGGGLIWAGSGGRKDESASG